MKLIGAEYRKMPRCHLYLMASAGSEGTESTKRVPGVLKAAILESAAAQVRKVRRADRMIQ